MPSWWWPWCVLWLRWWRWCEDLCLCLWWLREEDVALGDMPAAVLLPPPPPPPPPLLGLPRGDALDSTRRAKLAGDVVPEGLPWPVRLWPALVRPLRWRPTGGAEALSSEREPRDVGVWEVAVAVVTCICGGGGGAAEEE